LDGGQDIENINVKVVVIKSSRARVVDGSRGGLSENGKFMMTSTKVLAESRFRNDIRHFPSEPSTGESLGCTLKEERQPKN
jgi:hypothetical protein